MKKSQFEGFELAAIEKFKAPIEKFHTKEDFDDWAVLKLEELNDTSFGGRKKDTTIQRIIILKEWFHYVVEENQEFSPAEALLIMNAVTKGLKTNDDTLPPVLNKKVLSNVLNSLEKRLKAHPKEPFDLNKMYTEELRAHYINETGESVTKWVKIPSLEHDRENFESNVDKLKILSHDRWCTKSATAEEYLKEGDIHIYLENGHPKAAIRMEGDKICEIKSEENNSDIPAPYLELIMKYVLEQNLNLVDYN